MHARILSVSVVVPAFKEAGRIPQSLRAIGEYAARVPATEFGLIVVDDKSTDGTASVAAQPDRTHATPSVARTVTA